MTDNRELDDTLDVEPLRSTETVCERCWLAYNTARGGCPTLECAP